MSNADMSRAGIIKPETPPQKRGQRWWVIVAVAVILGIVIFVGSIFVGVLGILKNSEAYQLAVTRLQSSPLAANALGAPISAGTPYGSIKTEGTSGTADLNFSVTGSKAKGTAYVDAVAQDGAWKITRLTLRIDGSDKVIELIAGKNTM